MAVVMRFFRWIWRKFTHWIFFWKHRVKLQETPVTTGPGSSKVLGTEKTSNVLETLKLVQPLPETSLLTMEDLPKLVAPCTALAEASAAAAAAAAATTTTTETRAEAGSASVELVQENRSLMQLPRTAVKSVSTLMVSALQSGWQKCTWKSSVSSTSVTSQIRTRSPLESPEAEMLREVYLVLWAMRKQLRQLARRQERRRQRHLWARTCAQPDPAPGLKQEVRSPL